MEGELELRKTSLEAQHSVSYMLRCQGQETHRFLQSTTMPDKVMELTLSPAVAILDRDTPTRGPGFIQNKSEVTTIAHRGSTSDKTGKGTWYDNCTNRFTQYKADNMPSNKFD